VDARGPAAGRFVTLEGPDGAGKTTQCRLLADRLRASGHDVTLAREPGGTALGEPVRTLLLARDDLERTPEADALLFNAARSQLVREVIQPALARGGVVVCDRYTDSTLAYQGYGAGLELDDLRSLADWATSGIEPDLTILLDLPVESGLGRRSRGSASDVTRFERHPGHDTAFHRRVRDGYLELATADPDRWRVVAADREAQAVAADVAAVVERWLRVSEPAGPAVRIKG
jgi:dTMP kinase